MASKLIASVLDRWDMAAANATLMKGGEVKELWLVDPGSASGRFVLRVYPSQVTRAQVEQELQWTNAIACQVREVPVAIPAWNGDLICDADGRVAVLSAFIEGGVPRHDSADHRTAAATVLGRIHRASEELALAGDSYFRPLSHFDWTSNEWWDRAEIERVFGRHSVFVSAMERLDSVAEILHALAPLPKAVIHNDFHRGNMIANDTEIVSVIDWDWATVDWRLLDLAAGVRSFISYGPTATADALAFVHAYRAVTNISPSELVLLPSAMRLKQWWTVWYDLGRAVRGDLDTDGLVYRATELPRLENFLVDLHAALNGATTGQ